MKYPYYFFWTGKEGSNGKRWTMVMKYIVLFLVIPHKASYLNPTTETSAG